VISDVISGALDSSATTSVVHDSADCLLVNPTCSVVYKFIILSSILTVIQSDISVCSKFHVTNVKGLY
jgi:hypothetical protein